jgi:putative PIN family toxin of toxin-antitoxin system
VLDTNVLVSAMLTSGGAPDLTLQLILQGDVILLVDGRILGEYDEVTARRPFGFDPGMRRDLLGVLATVSEHVPSRPLRLALPDPEDRMFVEVAVHGRAEVIVTGNTRYFVLTDGGSLQVPVLTPRQFTDQLRQ